MTMLVLGIESATDRVGVAIGDHHGVRALFEATLGRRHAETVAPAVDFVRRQADVDLRDLSAIAVDIGPGLFTGLRVGLATAKTLAQALELPMIGVTSLEVLAHPLRRAGQRSTQIIASVVDGRKGQVFFAFFRTDDGDIRQVDEPRTGSVEDLVAAIDDRAQDVLCVGDGAIRYGSEIAASRFATVGDSFEAHPGVASLVHLAITKARREEFTDHRELNALYLRRPDAEINWTTRSGVTT
ncbi:MAG: tRNA (adenosine(37)-N6)-threonylcarbamoyltransferase complex dimerization subunit type 1 TsaB [Actinomycetota bacterium]